MEWKSAIKKNSNQNFTKKKKLHQRVKKNYKNLKKKIVFYMLIIFYFYGNFERKRYRNS